MPAPLVWWAPVWWVSRWINFQHLGHQQSSCPPRAWSLLACLNLMIVFIAVFTVGEIDFLYYDLCNSTAVCQRMHGEWRTQAVALSWAYFWDVYPPPLLFINQVYLFLMDYVSVAKGTREGLASEGWRTCPGQGNTYSHVSAPLAHPRRGPLIPLRGVCCEKWRIALFSLLCTRVLGPARVCRSHFFLPHQIARIFCFLIPSYKTSVFIITFLIAISIHLGNKRWKICVLAHWIESSQCCTCSYFQLLWHTCVLFSEF